METSKAKISRTVTIKTVGDWTFGDAVRAGFCNWEIEWREGGGKDAKIVGVTETPISSHLELDQTFRVPTGATHYRIIPGTASLGDNIIHKIGRAVADKDAGL